MVVAVLGGVAPAVGGAAAVVFFIPFEGIAVVAVIAPLLDTLGLRVELIPFKIETISRG